MLVTVNDLDWEKNIFEVNNVITGRQWHYYKGRHEKNFRENLPLKCNNTTRLGCCITRIPVVPRSARNPSCKSNNNWLIRQRAFIEIWSTREVWRVRKMRKFGEHERCVRVARGVAESNSNFLNQLLIKRWLPKGFVVLLNQGSFGVSPE